MRFAPLVALALLAAASAAAQQATYTNPILYADYSDPDVIRVGNDYYMVASTFTFRPASRCSSRATSSTGVCSRGR